MQRRLLAWIGATIGATAALAVAAWLWLLRPVTMPGDLKLIAAGLALLAAIMALRCIRLALVGGDEQPGG